jgi:GDPmannose 4,6-dehydratase
LQDCLYLGNLDAKRDWGHAKDYVEAQWLILQQDKAEDFAIATGEQHSVREFVDLSAKELGIKLRWQGDGVDEVGIIADLDTEREELAGKCPVIGSVIIRVDPRYYRPCEVETLLGDPTKSREQLGWVPKISFAEMVTEMVTSDLEEAKRDALCQSSGFRTFDRHE